jgi:hypothetical protein
VLIKNNNINSFPDLKKSTSNKVFHRSLQEMGNFALPNKEADCINIEYKLNSQGYRCNDFENQEILILGCSQTEGHGLPINLTWPYLISKKMNQDYINLAKGGDGMQSQVTKAFQFFKEFYNPKYIFAVFPLTRLEAPLINIQTIHENKRKNAIKKGEVAHSMKKGEIAKVMISNSLNEKFSKAPHVLESVLPEEFAIFYNIIFMKMLIQYCETNNIKLIWTYYNDSSLEIPSFKDISDGYFDGFYLDDPINEKCHLGISDNELFNNAADYNFWPPGHWGFHKQTHIAESFYNML